MSAGFVEGRQPTRPGDYERLSLLGVRVDAWDGKQWRRVVAQGSAASVDKSLPIGARGVVCANQNLPWRELYQAHPLDQWMEDDCVDLGRRAT